MAIPLIPVLIVAGLLTAGGIGIGVGVDANSKTQVKNAQNKLKKYSGSDSNAEFEAYLRDNMHLGYIDGNTYKNTLAAYTKLRNNNYDFSKLSIGERKELTKFYNQMYENNHDFKSLWDKEYSKMTDEEKLEFLGSGTSLGATVPAPAYLDTSFDRFQREVAPLKLYTNKELAELMNLDFDYNNILQDYENAAQADVEYKTWLSDLIANNSERDDAYNQTSYLDAIRNVKSDAIIKGMSNGARAAAEVVANKEAIQNKVDEQTDAATQRFETLNEALLNRAQAPLNATDVYNGLAQKLGSGVNTLYATDVNRRGQDLLTNANLLSADENLRSNRMAQNNLMSAMYNAARASNAVANAQAAEGLNYFKDITLPANDYDWRRALSDYIKTAYIQNTGYSDPMAKWGSGVNK